MKRTRLVALSSSIAAAVLIVVFGLGDADGRASLKQFHYDACPRADQRDLSSVFPFEAVVAGARSRIPHVFAEITKAQGRHPRLTQRSENIGEVIAMSMFTRQTANYRKAAAKFCGAAVAGTSWAVVVQFPDAAMASADELAAFLVKTKQGWSLYGSIWVNI